MKCSLSRRPAASCNEERGNGSSADASLASTCRVLVGDLSGHLRGLPNRHPKRDDHGPCTFFKNRGFNPMTSGSEV